MSKKPPVPPSQPSPSDKKKTAPKPSPESASKNADKDARKGEPLPAETPRDRSPKQENL